MGRLRGSVWLPYVCIFWLVFFVGCSAQQQMPDRAVDDPFAGDPFDDPFFAQAPAWDASVMQHSEVLLQQEADAQASSADAPGSSIIKEEESTLEKGQNIVFTSVVVGASLAKILLVPLLIP